MRNFLTCCVCLCITIASSAGVFDVVKNLPRAERLAKALDIFDNQVKFKDSVFAILSIEQLVTIAKQLDDQALECQGISFLADQYARIRQANGYSVQLHQKAIQLAEKNGSALLKGISNYRMGRYYYSFKNYPFALEYLLRSDNYFREIGYKEVPDIADVLFFLGSIYYETGNYDKAETALRDIQKLNEIRAYIQKQSLNTLALIRKEQNDTAGALLYFQQTLDVSVKQNDSTWMGICYSNIGSLYFSLKQYHKAYVLLTRAKQMNVNHKQWADAHSDLLLMARIYLLQNRIGQAQKKIDSAVALQKFTFTIKGRRNLYEAMILYYEKTNQQTKALEEQRKLMLVKDSLAVSKDQQAYRKILLRIETEKHLSEIDKLEAEAGASKLKRNAVIAGLVFLLVVSLLVYRFKAKKDGEILLQKQHLLQAEKLLAEEKLKDARKLLQNFTGNLRLKNELIEQFATELERLKSNIPGQAIHDERLKNYEKLVQSSILSQTEWDDFRNLFDKVHKGFFQRLTEKLPGLSVTDTRLISLIKLQLSTREMANMMGIGFDAVAQSKQQLRTKIHPANDGLGLDDIVQAI